MPYLDADGIRSRAQPLSPLSNEQEFTDAQLEAYVAEFEEVAEDYCGVAFEPRTVTGELHVVKASTFRLRWPEVSVDALTVDDTAFTADDYVVDTHIGRIFFHYLVDAVVDVDYDHGLAEPPAALLRACFLYVRSVALGDTSDTPRDAFATSAEGVTLRFVTPDKMNRRPTGFLEVDRILNSMPNYKSPGLA